MTTIDIKQRLLKLLRSPEHFSGVVLAIIVGILSGLGAVAFWKMTGEKVDGGFHALFFNLLGGALDQWSPYYIILLPAIGGLIIGLILHFLARGASGEGVPEVMEVLTTRGKQLRARSAVVRAVTSAMCLGSGGSAGPEGPIVHIGSAIGSAVGRVIKLPEDWTRTLILCGAAGGISATFNAPIGGIFFALEIVSHRVIARSFAFVVISSVSASIVSRYFLGDCPSFILPHYTLVSYWEILLYALLGAALGFASFLFIRVFYKCTDIFQAWKFPSFLKPACGGILVGCMGMYNINVLGVGYGGVNMALAGQIGFTAILALAGLKIIATSITLGSGSPGGLVAPSLVIGAMLGGVFGEAVNPLFPGIAISPNAYVMVGMAAFFAATLRGPLTAIFLLLEMTAFTDYALALPLMVAVIVSFLVARTFGRDSIYTMNLTRRGIDIHRRRETDIMKGTTVEEIMTRDFPTIAPTMSVTQLVDTLHRSGHHGFPVIDDKGELFGIVTLEDVENIMQRRSPDPATLTVKDIATHSPIIAYPDQTVYQVVMQLGGRDVGRIPVVDRSNPKKLLGVLRRRDIVRHYARTITQDTES